MRDGSYYRGDFVKGEMTGEGERTWEDGSIYTGDFLKGEKHGDGLIEYGTKNTKDKRYEGEWHLNSREGHGELLLRDGTLYKG